MRHGMACTAAARLSIIAAVLVFLGFPNNSHAQEAGKNVSSYMAVDIKEPFAEIMTRMQKTKPEVMKRQMDLLNERYDLGDRPAKGVTMSRGKPIQEGVRVKLAKGMTWEKLAATSPEEIKEKDLFPAGFFPLPHPNHPEGGMVFPKFHIEEIKKQEGRDLTRFDLDFDLPDHFLPEEPATIYLTARPNLCFARQAGNDRELLRALQRHPEPQAARRFAAVGDAFPSATVQPDRRSSHRTPQPWRGLS